MQNFNRRDFLNLLATGTAAGLAGCAHRKPYDPDKPLPFGERPNILFIMSDDHAAHAMGCYGSKINQTPNLDRLAREGMLFRNCFVTNSICAPSRAAILTGKYGHINGQKTNAERFDGRQWTFPKLLRQAGYQTALIGKWHLRSAPTGFDHWSVLTGQGAYFNPRFTTPAGKNKILGYTTDLITDQAIDWLTTRGDEDRPFCLMVQHKAPHRRWEPDDKHAHMYEDGDIPEPETFNDDYATRGTAARTTQMTIDKHLKKNDVKGVPPTGLTREQRKKWYYQRYIKDYLRCVAALDDNVGRLLDHLEQTGLAENTMVVYTSDQGFFLGDHNWYDKRFMYEESLRMPLLVRYPGKIKAGMETDDIALNVDFAPTFLALAGADNPAAMQGRDLTPILAGRPPADWRESMYYHYYEYPAVHMVRRHYGVRTHRYKLIHFYHQMDEWELYDLAHDPHELKNLYNDPAYAGVREKLKVELQRLRQELRETSGSEAAPKHPDFAHLYDADIRNTNNGYTLTGHGAGYALKQTAKPFKEYLRLHCTLRTRVESGLRNGLLVCGPDHRTDNMVAAGVHIGAGAYVVQKGHFGDNTKTIRKPTKFEKSKSFAVTMEVDLHKKEVKLTVDGTTMTTRLTKNWEEINYFGYLNNNTITYFSALEVTGR